MTTYATVAEVLVTDTFGGEPNYSWVERFSFPADGLTDLQVVRRAKAMAGWTGWRCSKEDLGVLISLRPRGCAMAMFITFREEEDTK